MEKVPSPHTYIPFQRAGLAILICLLTALCSAAQRQEMMAPSTGAANIKDALAHESLKGVLAGVRNLKEGKVGEIVSRFSGTDARWVWTVEEGDVPGQANAHTKPAPNGVVTTLNYSRLKGATRLSVARTLIHEMIHAYLVLSFRYDTNAATKYPRIEAAYKGVVPAPELNEVHHREMAQSFVAVIASALKEYGRSLGLSVSDSVYTDLAWGGLDFQHNEELADENKLRIQRRLKAEQFDTPVFPDVRPVGQQMGD